MNMKKKLLIILLVIIVPLLITFFIIRTYYPDNIAETAPDGGKKDLKTRFYKTDLDKATATVKEIIPTLSTYGSNWKLVEGNSENGQSNNQKIIKVEVPVVFFTDDLQVTLKNTEEGAVQIDLRSASRVGKSDFGENRRHVVQILEALDKKFGRN